MRFVLFFGLAMVLGFSGVSFAADDPSITGDTRKGIQSAMKNHIDQNLVNGNYVVYDAVEGHLKKLKFDQVHEGIVKKGDFYVSCADFVDDQGKKYDLDLLVVDEKGAFRVLETVVHSIDGKKRKYHLED
jgi:hypothetical protein